MTARRRFVFVSHTVKPDGNWPLDDLCGRAGRVDVLCRNIQAAMFLSHGLREDTDVYLVLVADPVNEVTIHIEGAKVQHLNPDERSTAARIRHALRGRHQDMWWEEMDPGLRIAPFGLHRIVQELDGTPVILHTGGVPLSEATLPEDPIFILGDHQPLTDAELGLFTGAASVSLGPVWYHGNHVTSILQYTMDQKQGVQARG
jgi:tRNA (pseudouridine54-N1)-methyltransferase